MVYGVTSRGFVKKRLEDIKAEKELTIRNVLGQSLNLLPSSVIGQLIGVTSASEAKLWDLAEASYNSQYPDTAFGISLDNAVRFTGVTRLEAQYSTVNLRVFGLPGTTIPNTFRASIPGSDTAIFQVTQTGVVGAGINAKQKIDFSVTPSSGTFTLVYNGQTTAPINATDTLEIIETKLEALSNITSVTVTGSISTAGLYIEFTGVDGQKSWLLPSISINTLSPSSLITPTYNDVGAQQGYGPFADLKAQAIATGPVQAFAGTITNIVTPIFNITGVTNLTNGILGSNIETDAELRQRQLELQQRQGTATVEGIRSAVAAVVGVTNAIVIENVANVPDIDGRPGKAFEVYARGGEGQEIANVIWKSKPAGIQVVGAELYSVVDSQGIAQPIRLSRPIAIEIYLDITLVVNTDPTEGPVFPVNGETLVTQAILEYGAAFDIGQDVINNRLYNPVNSVPGVIGVVIKQGLTASPATSANISIPRTSLAVFDAARITVTV